MTKRKTKGDVARIANFPRKVLNVSLTSMDIDVAGREAGDHLVSPQTAAARAIAASEYRGPCDGALDAPGLAAALKGQAEAVQAGDMRHAEAMLVNQASSLQSLFVRLTERAMQQQHMPNLEGFMRLALRAQSQCRATLETLATIKNPPVIYARQANVTTGPQQVNTVMSAPSEPTHTVKSDSVQSKLLEGQKNGDWMDTGTARTTSGTHPDLAAVGAIDRAENG